MSFWKENRIRFYEHYSASHLSVTMWKSGTREGCSWSSSERRLTQFIERRENLPAQKHLQLLWKRFRGDQPADQTSPAAASKGKIVRSAHQRLNVKQAVCGRCKKYICKGCAYCPICADWELKAGQVQDTGCVQNIRKTGGLNLKWHCALLFYILSVCVEFGLS